VNPEIITTVASASGMLVALWSIMSNFDKRNGERFNSLEKEIQAVKETLRAEIQATKETLCAEMLQMRAEVKLEIRESEDRRVTK
jgi:hypothetical protein